MKKIFLIGAAALGMFFMTTSCMDNTEPAGIEEMRMAKSELLRAEALYKQALAATEQANAAIKQAQAEYAELTNQIREIDVQKAQLGLELAQAENEYKIAQLEYEYQMQMAADSAEIMRLQSLIAGYEWEILRNEMEMDKLEYQREENLEVHKINMYNLQKQTAEAQQKYEEALAKIEAASYGLTEDQKTSLNNMVLKMQYFRGELNKAENALIKAQNDLLDAQYALGRDTVYYKELYQLEKEAWGQKVTDLQALLEEASAMNFTDLDELTADKEELEAKNQQIDKDIAALRSQAADKAAAELTPLQAQLKEIDAQKDQITQNIKDLYLQVGYEWDEGQSQYVQTAVTGAMNERHVFELEIPEAIVDDVASQFNQVFCDNKGEITKPDQGPGADDIVILSGFEEVDGEWTLPGGIYSWEATYATTKEKLNGTNNDGLLDEIASMAIDPAKLSNYQLILSEQEAKKAEIDADYAFYLDVYNKGLAEFNTLAAEYGITYNSAWEFVADKDNLLAKATEAYEAYTAAATPTAAQTEAFVVAVYNEQKARQALVGTAVAGWDKLTYANITATTPTATMQQVLDTYNDAKANPVENILQKEGYAYTEPITTESKLEDYCAAAKWNEASEQLYEWTYLRAAITEDIIGYGDIFEINAELTNWASLMPGYEIDEEAELAKRLKSLGGDNYSVEEFKKGLYYKQLGMSELVDAMSSIIANNTSFIDLDKALNVINDEIKALEKEDNAGQTEIFLQIRDLYAQQDSLSDQVSEINVQIAAKELEISAIAGYESPYVDKSYSQAQILDDQKEANKVTIGLIDQAIAALKYEIDGKDVAGNGPFTFDGESYDTIEELHDAWIKNIKEDIALAQRELAETEESLARLLDPASGDPLAQAVANAERALEQAQQDYDIALQQFNYWSEALNQMLAALLGNEEVPENPEA